MTEKDFLKTERTTKAMMLTSTYSGPRYKLDAKRETVTTGERSIPLAESILRSTEQRRG
jgi:hypothetical protein